MQIQAATLRRVRQDRGVTQTDLAAATGLTVSYLSKLESGAKANPSETVVSRLAGQLDVAPFVLRFDPDDATAHLAKLELAKGATEGETS
jgi:transcriptional regulator with XRE-family HTH domain